VQYHKTNKEEKTRVQKRTKIAVIAIFV